MGLMVGGSAGGSSIGVAPHAQWIAVKIFRDNDSSTSTGVIQGFEWLLDPDNNPDTDDAPHVVNNSWGFQNPGCHPQELFRAQIQILRAAGILPVFSAGNEGPGTSTGTSPAVYPESFAVGMVNNEDIINPGSSRGPSSCGGEVDAIFPEITAPGVNTRTTDRVGYTSSHFGTSVAAPHVTAGMALLLQAFPALTPEQQAAALTSTTLDLGIPGPDNSYGYGRLDLLAAYRCLQEGVCVHSIPLVVKTFFPAVFMDTGLPQLVPRSYLPILLVEPP
jgi:subtilisin family serine protease